MNSIAVTPSKDIRNGVPPELDPSLDVELAANIFKQTGRLLSQPFLSAVTAETTFSCLDTEVPWQLHFNEGSKSFDLDESYLSKLSESEQGLIRDTVHENARHGFQYLFSNFPISDIFNAGRYKELYVMRLYEFLNSTAFLDLVKQISGITSVHRADAQATLYRPGHFLTRHDDLLPDSHRRLAYVLGFTPKWRPDWGGILNFLDSDNHISEGFLPTFNSLTLFKVPQPHAVSFVAPFARANRYSISGWLLD